MGSLHAGHIRLIEQAKQECGIVVISIFVNPLQFDREDDLKNYPRTLADDIEICKSSAVDIVFTPSLDEIYPTPQECTIEVGRLGTHLCGKYRPGHLNGVATVVMKLLQIVRPERAYFGEKDAQQLAIIRCLVRDFLLPVTVVGIPTVREADGLALSSRNQLLSPVQRQTAIVLYKLLLYTQKQIAAGIKEVKIVKELTIAQIPKNAALRIEYLELVDPENMQPVQLITGPVLAAGAAWIGTTRLIDNVICNPIADTH
jgi:pantoate--beta-alanine ligase